MSIIWHIGFDLEIGLRKYETFVNVDFFDRFS